MDGRELRQVLDTNDLIRRAYGDDRFPRARNGATDLRAFAVTTAWVLGIERRKTGVWDRVCDILHLDAYWFWITIAEDAPRYEPDDMYRESRGCVAPMIRRSGPCGKLGNVGFRVTDPADGTWRSVHYCNRHHEDAERARLAERARVQAGVPEPLPNRGGLLPCYISWDWPDRYAYAKAGWKPPKVGIRADDWPVMAQVRDLEPPKLKVIFGGAEMTSHSLPPDGSSAPSLTLIRSDR